MHFLNKKLYGVLVLVAMVVTAATSALAQSNYGALRGMVTDVQGASVTNATISLTAEDTKIIRTTTSNGAGEYVFSAVAPGVYTVTVTTDGFKKSESKGIRVDAGNTIPLDVRLELGSMSQSVEVTAAEPIVNNGTSFNGQLIDSQKLQNLPNPGRNPFLFSKLDNNVTAVGDPRFVRFQDQSGSSTISIAGAPLSSNNYAVDGIPITDFSNRAVIIPSIESVQEVKVQANTYDAEIGRTSGGMFNTTLRSGSSALHGVLQGQTRQTNWGANLFFNNRTPYTSNGVTQPTTPRGAAEFYTYAGSIGGPIPLPKILGGKDKTFFWITGEGYRQRSPLTAANSFVVPTLLQRGTSIANAGDFSEIGQADANGNCISGRCIYDPLSPTRQAFPFNKIPSNRINPVGYAILAVYPQPNTNVTSYGGFNFNGGDTLGDRADEFVGKVTHSFGERWLADFYYMHYGSKEPGGNALQNFAGSSSSYLLYRKVDAIGIQNTITLNPTTILTAGFGFNRFPNDTKDISVGFNQAALGFPANYLAALSKTGFPAITGDAGLASQGTSNSGPAVYFSRNFVTGIAKSMGRHSLKAGYVFRAISLTYTSLSNTSGTFAFDSTLTNSGVSSTSGSSGATAADMLLGYPTSGSLVVPTQLAITSQYNAIYGQDDVRVTPKLTLNLGLRYEHEPGVNERHNRYSVGFDRTTPFTVAGSTVQAVGGIEFAGQGSYPTATGQTVNKISPRAGFAYAITPQTVVRGGYGLFYQPLVYSGSASLAPGYVLTNVIPSQSGVPAINLSNPFPTLSTTPTGNTLGLSTSIGSSLSLIDQARKAPFYQSYSADIQQELPHGFALKIGYVGGHGRNQPNSLNINQLSDNYFSLGNAALTNKVPFKFAGTGAWSSANQPYNQSLRPFPQFTTITDSVSDGITNFNALNVKVQKLFSNGLTVLGAFTWASNWDNLWGASSTLNPLISNNNGAQDVNNIHAEYARSINNIPKRTTLALTYELPFGHGKQFLSGANRWMDLAVGGWTFNNIMIIQDGAPLPISQTTNSNSAFGNLGTRPSLVPGVNPCYSGRPQDRLNAYFNPAAFSTTPAGSYGNSPRTLNCYGPGYANFDLSLNKSFHVTERVNAEFRAEALNAFNTPQFNGPNLAADSSTAGKITGTLGFPRLVQLGGRLTF
ncbi:carboxypeptidase family protein [Edaphobacter aggregans]|uniref:Carboxypeptidase family protein n=1 Tax=Edaphobacter aggregans TaxID=570835 RepID=A0A3R9NT42_9BACT|nr:TonB-dependent receptor [Edaphobacter aggregans]RSL16138.1 carboxypeptidase family protein [Edaphobacter aggregans]